MQSAYEITAAILKFYFDQLAYEEYLMLAGRCKACAELKQRQKAERKANLEYSNIKMIKCNAKSK